MAREIPEAVRAAAGLTATVLDEVRRLPETLPSLPVRVLGMAMQLSMKLQQHYADLVARGDELFTGIRGEDEPGLATFDDDDEDAGGLAATATKVGTSAFDRVAETVIEVTEDDDAATDEVLDELAIEELVDEAPASGGADALVDALLEGDGGTDSDADGLPEPEVLEQSPAPVDGETADVATDVENLVDVPAPDGGVETVEATVTDEGVAAPEPETATDEGGTPVAAATGVRTALDADAESAGDESDARAQGAAVDAVGEEAPAPTDDPQGGSELAGSQAAGTAPVEGYDGWSIAQLRGRLRGYQSVTVADLLAYEEATRAREPYLRMLRNRLSKLDEQAIESSPLAPRGA